MDNTDNSFIPLLGFTLPRDFPQRIGLVAAVNEHLRLLRSSGYFIPPRFFGYFFQGKTPVAVSGRWTVKLECVPPVSQLPEVLDYITQGKYSITANPAYYQAPDYMFIHDRWDETCSLRRFSQGLCFVEAIDPVLGYIESS